MRASDFGPGSPGRLAAITVTRKDRITGLPVDVSTPAFVPAPLPDSLSISGELAREVEEANHLLGRLRERADRAPNLSALQASFARREAVSSSRIEGTQTTLEGLLIYEQGGLEPEKRDDAREVQNYVRALDYGFKQPTERGITEALIREIHALLMEDGDTFWIEPGRYRRGAVYVGGQTLALARYVPPPASDVPNLMRELVESISSLPGIPRLVWIGMLHYQFEAIHPFNDGNGRTGRVLISLLMQHMGLLRGPVLHLSNYIERTKREYVDGLTRVSLLGAWEEWNRYFVHAVVAEAGRALATIADLDAIADRYEALLRSGGYRGDRGMVEALLQSPVITITSAAKTAGVSYNTAKSVFDRLLAAGVLREIRGVQRNKLYRAEEVLEVLEAQFD